SGDQRDRGSVAPRGVRPEGRHQQRTREVTPAVAPEGRPMLAGGEANEVSATPGTRCKENEAPEGRQKRAQPLLSPLRGFRFFSGSTGGCASVFDLRFTPG